MTNSVGLGLEPTLWFAPGLLLIDLLLRIGVALRVVMRRLSLPATLAWLLLLLFLPFVGLPFYFMVGENRLGRARAARAAEVMSAIRHRAAAIWTGDGPRWKAEETETKQLVRLLTTVGGIPPLRGNRIEVISETPEFLKRVAEDIDRAKEHCHLLFYIWSPLGRTSDVGEALIRAAERGVVCRVLVDAVGSGAFLKSPMCAKMKGAGVMVCAALPVNPVRMLFARVDLRNHRKIVVIDHAVGYTGSHNLAEADFLAKQKPKAGDWVDASIRLEGPAVTALQSVFLGDWLLDSVEPEEEVERLAKAPAPMDEGGCVVQVIPSGPDRESGAIQQAMLALIYAADRELIITTPYFVPDEATRTALCIAARRGVRTTIVVPAKPDARLVAAASRAFFQELLDAGVRIRQFKKGLLHAKTITIDAEYGVITSVNMDMRSFFLNFESTVVVYDRRFAEELRRVQNEYMHAAPEVSAGEWAHRPRLHQFVDNLAQLAAPLL